MNANCIICSDLFSLTDEIFVTKCGHVFHHACLLQWIERSKTCPQCRKKATGDSIIRIYPNFPNSEGITLDAGALQMKLDSVEFNLREKEKDLLKSYEEKEKIEEIYNASKINLMSLEKTLKDKTALIKMMKERIEYMKADTEEVSRLQNENKKMMDSLENLKCLQDVISGTTAEVEVMVKNMPDAHKLCTYVVALKKSFIKSESKKKSLQDNFHALQNELHKTNSQKTESTSRIKLLESSIAYLEEKVKKLEKELAEYKTNSNKSLDVVIKKTLIEEKLKQNLNVDISESEKDKMGLPNIYHSQKEYLDGTLLKNKELSIEPNFTTLKDDKNSESPYLCLKQSSSIYKNHKQESAANKSVDVKNHFYILKNKKFCESFDNASSKQLFNGMAIKRKELETTYDGLGGHSKPEIFPGSSRTFFKNNLELSKQINSTKNVIKKLKKM